MYRMTGLEYKQIFAENQLKHSEIITILEECIRTLSTRSEEVASEGNIERAIELQEKAEEAKWVAIFTAMDEKEQGWCYLENHNTNNAQATKQTKVC